MLLYFHQNLKFFPLPKIDSIHQGYLIMISTSLNTDSSNDYRKFQFLLVFSEDFCFLPFSSNSNPLNSYFKILYGLYFCLLYCFVNHTWNIYSNYLSMIDRIMIAYFEWVWLWILFKKINFNTERILHFFKFLDLHLINEYNCF